MISKFKKRNYYTMMNVIVVVIILEIGIVVVNADVDTTKVVCEATRKEYWSSSKGRCVRCRDCPAGQGRNVTDKYIVIRSEEHGATQCFPCKPCPTFHFAQANQCNKCYLDKCKKLHRKVLTECNSQEDVKCSPICLDRYHSEYGENDYYFPCVPDTVLSSTPDPVNTPVIVRKVTTLSAAHTPHVVTKVNLTSTDHNSGFASAQQSARQSHALSYETTMGLVSGAISAFVLFTVFAFLLLKKPWKQTHSRSASPLSSEESMSLTKEVHVHDVEIDGLVVQETHQDKVRGELSQNDVTSHLRQELSQAGAGSYNSNDDHRRVSETIERVCMLHNNSKQICDCQYKINCNTCRMDTFKGPVTQAYINIVAKNICHHPEKLFRNLGIPIPEIYAKNDDRDRCPDKISQPEYISQVLISWTRSKCENATLNDLAKALCKECFHHINDEIFKFYHEVIPVSNVNIENERESTNPSLSEDVSLYLQSDR